MKYSWLKRGDATVQKETGRFHSSAGLAIGDARLSVEGVVGAGFAVRAADALIG
ncbi:hypothetical protein [Rhodoblastus sp.]|uniref:hypothetical protein n=1 Tax=Rhodoblastus sp. TaxID=1962975 RepID=UPI003F94BA8D